MIILTTFIQQVIKQVSDCQTMVSVSYVATAWSCVAQLQQETNKISASVSDSTPKVVTFIISDITSEANNDT